MGKIIKKRVEYGGSSNSAENIKYDDTKNVKEAINEVKSEIADVNSKLVFDLPTFCNSDNITNLNNAKSDKTYSGIAYKGATNYPDTESSFCLVTFFSAYTDVFGVQFAHTDISDIYSRSVQNGVWTNWKKLNN